jgi:hypothetical protein
MLIQNAQLRNICEESACTSVRLAPDLVYISSGTLKLLKGRLETRHEMAEGITWCKV